MISLYDKETLQHPSKNTQRQAPAKSDNQTKLNEKSLADNSNIIPIKGQKQKDPLLEDRYKNSDSQNDNSPIKNSAKLNTYGKFTSDKKFSPKKVDNQSKSSNNEKKEEKQTKSNNDKKDESQTKSNNAKKDESNKKTSQEENISENTKEEESTYKASQYKKSNFKIQDDNDEDMTFNYKPQIGKPLKTAHLDSPKKNQKAVVEKIDQNKYKNVKVSLNHGNVDLGGIRSKLDTHLSKQKEMENLFQMENERLEKAFGKEKDRKEEDINHYRESLLEIKKQQREKSAYEEIGENSKLEEFNRKVAMRKNKDK